MTTSHHGPLICIFLMVATLLVYYQVLNHNFVLYDDGWYVAENVHVISGINSDSLKWAFSSFRASNWHPITWLSHMVDCQIFGVNPGAHHLTNLLFHMANTLLLFFVFRKMTDNLWQSGFVAALFALHPLHVESVVWVSERKDVLSTFFWMLTMWSYIWYVMRPSVNRYIIIVLFFTLGLMSKPMLVTMPFVLLLLDFYPLNRFQFQPADDNVNSRKKSIALHLILEKIPLFVLVAMSSAITFYAQKHGGSVSSLDSLPLGFRGSNALVSYVNYMGKMVYPFNLAVFYPYPETLPWWKITGAGILLVSISFLAIRAVKKRPYFIVGWLWYLGTLIPVIGLVQVGYQSMADRYTYVPLIGLFIIISWGLPELVEQWKHGKKWFPVLAVTIIAFLMIVTWKQVGYWENSITLFEQTLKVTSNNARAYNSLGTALDKQGRLDEAIKHYLHALRIEPDFVQAHYNLGNSFGKQGRLAEAIKYYLQALEIKPDYVKVHNNLGLALDKQGRSDEAIKHYLHALRIEPDFVQAHNNLGIALARTGDIEGAIASFKEAIRINPNFSPSENNLKRALIIQQKKQ